MCLEDQFLLALYRQPDAITLRNMANQLFITETALLSIINRISTNDATYVIQTEQEDQLHLAANPQSESQVRQFLADGGFTAINERELRDYYATEMERFAMLERIRETLKQYTWMKWASGLAFLTGSGFAVMRYLKSRRA